MKYHCELAKNIIKMHFMKQVVQYISQNTIHLTKK